MTRFSNLIGILLKKEEIHDRTSGHFSFWGSMFLLSLSFLIFLAAPIFANAIGDSGPSNVVTATPGGAAAQVQTPVAGSTLSTASVTFTWNTGSGATGYWLRAGTSAGSNNIADSGQISVTSYTVNNIPLDGSTLYVRLSTLIGTSWVDMDYTYGTSSTPVVRFQGTGTDVKEYIGTDGHIQRVNYTLTVDMTVYTSNPQPDGDIVRYDLTRKVGTVNFSGVATDNFTGETLNFEQNRSIDIQGTEGSFEYSKSDVDYQYIIFNIPIPASPTLPYVYNIQYAEFADIIRAAVAMPSPWNQGFIDNTTYDISGTDDFDVPCFMTADPADSTLVPGDTTEIYVSTPLRPGDTLQWEVVAVEDSTARAVVTPGGGTGKTAVISDIRGKGALLVRVTNPSIASCQKDIPLEVGCGCGASGSGETCALKADINNESSIDVDIDLGRGSRGNPVGNIVLKNDVPSPSNATPGGLKIYTLDDATEVLTSNTGTLRQVVGPEVFADVTTLDSYSYQIAYYSLADKGPKVNGYYQVLGGAVPLKTWTVENPDRSASVYNRLRITESGDGTPEVYEYAWNAGLGVWSLNKGSGLQVEAVTEAFVSGTRVVTETIQDGVGATASKTRTTYKNITSATGVTEEVIGVVEDPDGAALTTTTAWYEDALDVNNYGHMASQVFPDGSWVRYSYDSLGRVSEEVHSWLDAAVGSPNASARVISYDYTSQDAADSQLTQDTRQPRRVIEQILGQEVSRTYYVYSQAGDGTRTTIVERAATPGAAYGNAQNQRTTTVTNPYSFGSVTSWRPQTVTYPDGKMDTTSYEYGTYTPNADPTQPGTFTPGTGTDERESVIHGTTTSPNGIAYKSTAERRVTNSKGELLLETRHVYDGISAQQVGWTVTTYDAYGHVTRESRSDGTLSESAWGCCTENSEVDTTGIEHRFTYDGLNRLLTLTKEAGVNDVITTYTYDAVGRRLSETKSAAGLTLSSSSSYDTAGRLLTSTDESGLVTGYGYAADNRTTTVTRPGGATETTTQYLDGQSKSVTGSGVIAQYTTYGVNADGSRWSQVNTGSVSSPVYEKTTVDMLGRVIRVERPGYSGVEVTQHYYNTAGQLVRTTTTGQADMLYEYDSLGNQVRAGLDVNASGTLDVSSTDRITDQDTVFTNLSGAWWQQTLQQVYATDNSATATTTATQRSRLSGFTGGVVEETVAIDINGNTTTAQTTINRATKTQTRTVDEPDSNVNNVTTTVNGLLTSEQGKTGVVTTYTYDALERLTGVTDPRTGTTTTSYNPTTGRVDYVQDPATNRVSYTYESATGRKATETNALNEVTRYAYNNRDQVTNVWGDVPYPVEYVYDSYGRLSQMRTWRTSAAWNGVTWPTGVAGQEDVTTWNYQESTGLLTSKVDDAGQPTTYTYTTGGKLATRTWARSGGTLVTTYSYDPNTSELLSVNYSDTTPDVTFTYDRLGRQTTITDGLGSRTFGYNTTLQPSIETISGLYSKMLTRTYESAGVIGRATGLNTGADYSVSYGYDPTGRFNSVGWNVNGVTGSASYTYVPNSDLLSTLTTASGQLTTYTYEPSRNLRTRINNQFNAGLVSQYDYVYDGIGRRTSVANSGSAFGAAAFNRFAYNGRSELSESARYLGTDINNLTSPVTGEYRSFVYDPIGNRTSITEATNAGTYTANNLNQYSLANLPGGGSNTFTHDPDGNLTTISGSKNVIYTYDGENRLITAQPTAPAVGDKKLDLTYDYQGRRVRKIVSNWTGSSWAPETTKYFVYDGWNVVEEQTVSQPSKYYVWGLDLSQSLQGAGGVGGLLTKVESTTTHNFLYDGNGNVGQLVNATTGAIDARYEYDAYGNSILATGTQAAGNTMRFSTKYIDGETGLYYYGYRYYDPGTGRWLSRDPVGEKSEFIDEALNVVTKLNLLYGFVENDSINSVDFLGLVKIEIRYNKLGALGDRPYYHAYIIVTDSCDKKTYYRAGPSAKGPSGGSSGQVSSGSGGSSSDASGSNSDSSNSTSPGSGKKGDKGPWGRISVSFGPYLPGTIDWNPNKTPAIVVLDNDDAADLYHRSLERIFMTIQNANIPYNPFTTNSNAAAHQAIQDMGLPRPEAPVWAPGADINLWK